MLSELNCPSCLKRMTQIHVQMTILNALTHWRCTDCGNNDFTEEVTPIDARIDEGTTLFS